MCKCCGTRTIAGLLTAKVGIIVMALIAVFIGSFRSVAYLRRQQISSKKPKPMTWKKAAMTPFICSFLLFSLYVLETNEKKRTDGEDVLTLEDVKPYITASLLFQGVLALTKLLRPLVNRLLPNAYPVIPYRLLFTKGKDETIEALIDYEFDSRDFVGLAISTALGYWYLLDKHWLANNLFGIALSIGDIENWQLNTVANGFILLVGMFFYDIFWVFATDAMFNVMMALHLPVRLEFPVYSVLGTQMGTTMLGLGDIVIPGIFIALLLRFDVSLKRKENLYFWTGIFGYILGLWLCTLVVIYTDHGQPALLYLVPLCLGCPLLVAHISGDIKLMFSYQDHPSREDETQSSKFLQINQYFVNAFQNTKNFISRILKL